MLKQLDLLRFLPLLQSALNFDGPRAGLVDLVGLRLLRLLIHIVDELQAEVLQSARYSLFVVRDGGLAGLGRVHLYDHLVDNIFIHLPVSFDILGEIALFAFLEGT